MCLWARSFHCRMVIRQCWCGSHFIRIWWNMIFIGWCCSCSSYCCGDCTICLRWDYNTSNSSLWMRLFNIETRCYLVWQCNLIIWGRRLLHTLCNSLFIVWQKCAIITFLFSNFNIYKLHLRPYKRECAENLIEPTWRVDISGIMYGNIERMLCCRIVKYL